MAESKDNDFFNDFDEFDDLDFSDFLNKKYEEELNGLEEDENVDHQWQPWFPVDMEHPAKLTDVQKERAMRIYEAITKHIDEHSDIPTPPLICITQDWRVRVDFGGWVSGSDFRESALCVMCHDDEGCYIDLEYVEQCVPFIEDVLKEIAEHCMTTYGEVPDHHEGENKRVLEAEMKILSILSDETIRNFGYGNVLIAIDTIEESIYPIPADIEHDDYGGIIIYVGADTLVEKDGSIEVDKVKALVNRILNPI